MVQERNQFRAVCGIEVVYISHDIFPMVIFKEMFMEIESDIEISIVVPTKNRKAFIEEF